jgi:hypothetical protein
VNATGKPQFDSVTGPSTSQERPTRRKIERVRFTVPAAPLTTSVAVVERGVVRAPLDVPHVMLLDALVAQAPLRDALAARSDNRHGAFAETLTVSEPGLS